MRDRSVTTTRSLEIARLKEKNNDLLVQLKRLNSEVSGRLEHAELKGHRKEADESPAITEGKLLNQLDCLKGETAMLETELKSIGRKLRVDASPQQIVTLEKRLMDRIRRNESATKEAKTRAKMVEKEEKRIHTMVATAKCKNEPTSALSEQKEEERLIKFVNKLLERQNDLEQQLRQEAENDAVKQEKVPELQHMVETAEAELEVLKMEARRAASEPEKTEVELSVRTGDELECKTTEELREELMRLKRDREVELKLNTKTRTELQETIVEAMKRLSELTCVHPF